MNKTNAITYVIFKNIEFKSAPSLKRTQNACFHFVMTVIYRSVWGLLF
jgi:hypothetical protein